jgi:hypothetical protein
MFATRADREECGRCGQTGAVGEGRVEPSQGRWLCSRCCERLSGPVVQRASTDTGRKRGAHSIILRELGWLQSQHEARRADKRQRTSPEAAEPPPAAVAPEAAEPAAAAAAPKPAARTPGEALLAAIRDCATHRPGADDRGRSGADAAAAAAVALVDAQRAERAALPPETLREALGASCRVGRLGLVRAVLRLMETGTPPYAHSSESVG